MEPTNIWKAAKYLTDSESSGLARITRLENQGRYAESCEEISKTLIKSSFPELPDVRRNTQAEADQSAVEQIEHAPLTVEEVKEAFFRASPFKARNSRGCVARALTSDWKAYLSAFQRIVTIWPLT